MKNIILLIILSIILSGCNKRDDKMEYIQTKIKGFVIDSITNIGVPKIKVQIEECRTVIVMPDICELFDTIYTDSTGYFEYVFNSEKS